ncbi:ribonuclease Z [Candidatus Woesearchaeota archaeon]|nr:ribonuclease Z [Candidatus Woesearchaeota archaeon]
MIQLTLLGTSCMVPTKERNVTSFFLDFNGEGILVDCGEGTQRQMNIANINRNKVKKILISHWHGDHVAGMLGLIQTISNNTEGTTIEIFGPKETKKRFEMLMNSTYFGNISRLNLKITEIIPKDKDKLETFYESPNYYLQAISLDHGIPTLGYRFVEKDKRRISTSKTSKLGIPEGPLLGKLQDGRSIEFKGKSYSSDELTYLVPGKVIAFIMDTAYVKNTIILAQDADVVISEATYLDKHVDKADQYKHMSVKQAAQIAHEANAKKLVMTHFSQRYSDVSELEEEARDIFPESYAGFDFMKIKV